MPQITWTKAPADVAQQCERLFQNGGPRVYVRDEGASVYALRAECHLSALRCAESADVGQTVYSRRKHLGRYEWMAYTEPADAYPDIPANIDPAKLRAIADSLVAGIVESLARIHGCSVAQVQDGLRAKHPKLMAQAKQLAERGATMALQLARDGAISISRT